MSIIGISGRINSGKDLVGKIIQELTINSNADYKIIKFADTLKDMVCLLLGCEREQLEDREFKEKELGEEWWKYPVEVTYEIRTGDNIDYETDTYYFVTKEEADNFYNKEIKNNPFEIVKLDTIKLTPRTLLQLLGTECGRQIIHPNIWVNSTLERGRLYSVEEKSNLIHPSWCITDCRFPNEADAIKSKGGINIRVNRSKEGYSNNSGIKHESETALDGYKFDYVIDNDGTIEDLVDKVKEILIKENIV